MKKLFRQDDDSFFDKEKLDKKPNESDKSDSKDLKQTQNKSESIPYKPYGAKDSKAEKKEKKNKKGIFAYNSPSESADENQSNPKSTLNPYYQSEEVSYGPNGELIVEPFDSKKFKSFVYTPPVKDKKLTIILLESTVKTKGYEEAIKVIHSSAIKTDFLVFIKYEKSFVRSSMFKADDFKKGFDLKLTDSNTETCLYDALVDLEIFVSEVFNKIDEKSIPRTRINSIDIIGIGTCLDTCSKASKEEGIKSFVNVLKKTNANTRYFCITDDSFCNAAEIGFRSIGAIDRKYQ